MVKMKLWAFWAKLNGAIAGTFSAKVFGSQKKGKDGLHQFRRPVSRLLGTTADLFPFWANLVGCNHLSASCRCRSRTAWTPVSRLCGNLNWVDWSCMRLEINQPSIIQIARPVTPMWGGFCAPWWLCDWFDFKKRLAEATRCAWFKWRTIPLQRGRKSFMRVQYRGIW